MEEVRCGGRRGLGRRCRHERRRRSKRGKGGEAMLVGCQGGYAGGVGERGGLCDVGGDTGGGREGRGRGIGRSTGTDPGGFGSVALEDFRPQLLWGCT